ncbi:hypothetical protein F511_30083 [Dorcoceras hygrometricum]|uniref:Uncharacterized protein n=1 Tax=Dorcoceras hygrometricum TaxID=472368 RepID=A0A2Z7BUK2_9LAMI|nr:hypothetical protein F511_30083 [Dorcoceras hygrometricum]
MRSFYPCQNSSVLLVQADEGVLIPVVDLIRRIYRRLQFKSQICLRILVGARRPDASKKPAAAPTRVAAPPARNRPLARFKSRAARPMAACWPAVANGHTQDVAQRRAQLGCAMGCASRSGVRPCAARYVGGGRRPANFSVALRRLISSRFSGRTIEDGGDDDQIY